MIETGTSAVMITMEGKQVLVECRYLPSVFNERLNNTLFNAGGPLFRWMKRSNRHKNKHLEWGLWRY